MVLAGVMVLSLLPENMGVTEVVDVAGEMGKMNIVNYKFDINDKYNIWTGMIAAFFLFMSYFGTDQSQVQRYLTGKSLTASRLGLMMNGLLKVPMQFMILMIGVFVFVFYQFNKAPLFFNETGVESVMNSEYKGDYQALEDSFTMVFDQKKTAVESLVLAQTETDNLNTEIHSAEVNRLNKKEADLRVQAKGLIQKADANVETNDTDYIFMTFVMDYLPVGMVGLLFSVMFCAAMSSTASELNALSATTTVDLYKRSVNKKGSDEHYLKSSRWFTFMWGIFAIIFAVSASLFENLIEAVNVLGSLFYGTILGIFVVAFYFKKIMGNAVFIGAIMSELIVLWLFYLNENEVGPEWLQMGYLWFNLVGCGLVILFATCIQVFSKKK